MLRNKLVKQVIQESLIENGIKIDENNKLIVDSLSFVSFILSLESNLSITIPEKIAIGFLSKTFVEIVASVSELDKEMNCHEKVNQTGKR